MYPHLFYISLKKFMLSYVLSCLLNYVFRYINFTAFQTVGRFKTCYNTDKSLATVWQAFLLCFGWMFPNVRGIFAVGYFAVKRNVSFG